MTRPFLPICAALLLAACGAEMLDFPLKTECCGASFGIPERPMTAQLSGRILEVATNMGADAIVGVRYGSAAVMQGAAEVFAYGTAVKYRA